MLTKRKKEDKDCNSTMIYGVDNGSEAAIEFFKFFSQVSFKI